nr:hypothetical protein [Bacillota bacterium]
KKTVVNTHHDVTKFNNDADNDYRKQGFSFSESNIYNFKVNDYREYITTWESYQPRCQKNEYSVLSDNKYLLYLTFGKYIKTPKVYGIIRKGRIVGIEKEDLTEDNLYTFIIQNNGAVIKDAEGCDGFNVYVLRVDGDKLWYRGDVVDQAKLLNIVSSFENAVIQEIMLQGEFENTLFPNSINTVRVISVKKKNSDEHEIIGALQRIGNQKSAPVDNFNQGGGSALIDLKTGRLGKMTTVFSVDENNNRIFYSNHPDTGAQIEGKVIPNWDKLSSTISDITTKIPFFKYIAWDFVVQDDGFALIETNLKSSLNVFQIHGGQRNKFLGQKYKEYGYIED